MKEALKNLLEIQPSALRGLHALAHMDFTQPYFIEEYSGKFTENSILKVVDNYINNDFYRSNYNIYVLYKPDINNFRWLSRGIYIAQIRKNTLLCTRDKIKTYDPYFWSKFDVMTMKKDFEEIRKVENTRYWIIIQAKSMEKYTEVIYYDKERYYVKEENGNTYVRPMSNNYPYIRAEKITYKEVDIDKSGYNRGIYHDELKQRLAEARRERSAAAAKVYDNTEKLAEFTQRLKAIHNRITDILNQPQPEYKKISNATSKLWWRDSDIEAYKLNQFDSIEQVRSTENRIDSTLNEVTAILD